MLIRLDPKSTDPMYRQIADAVAVQIVDGRLEFGERLPAARVLAGVLGVNMHTVLKAYEHLEGAGLVDMRRGRGGVTVVAPPGIEEMALSLADRARRQGLSKDDLLRLVEEAW